MTADERICITHGGAQGVHFNGDRSCKWVRRFRLKVGALEIPAGWGWFYEVHDMERPEGRRLAMSGLRPSWHAAMVDGGCARRFVEKNRTQGWL